MPYSRDSFSSYWLIVWVTSFFVGMFVLFTFLLGYNPFGLYQGEKKGQYMISSVNGNIFLGEKFLGDGENIGSDLLGAYDVCIEKYGYKKECFAREIQPNEFPFLNLEWVYLLHRNLSVRDITSEKVYFDQKGRGFFWYDIQKKILFVKEKGEEDFVAYSLKKDPLSISFDPQEERFFYTAEKESEKIFLDIFSFELDISSVEEIFSLDDKKFIPSNFSILKKEKDIDTLIASFSLPAQEFFFFEQGFLFVFPSSVWRFDPHGESFQKLIEKDENSQTFFHEKTNTLFFLKEGVLKQLFL